jgi:hypothetical protein
MWAFGKARYPELLLLSLRWCLSSLYGCLGWDESLILVVACLTCLFTSCYILAHGYLLVILYWSLYEDSLLFYKSWYNGVYNCLNTFLYNLWNTLILISYIASCSSLGLCLMSSLPKGERLCVKLVELLLIGWLREKHDNVYLRRRACIESVRESFWVLWVFCVFELFLATFRAFYWPCRFSFF